MTFVDAFFSFALDISDANRNIYQATRIKTPKHPDESYQHLVARLLAFVHSFQDSLKFSYGLYDTNQPTIWAKNSIGDVTEWIQVGELHFQKLRRAVLHHHQATFKAFFYTEQQLEQFCKEIKGNKNGWIHQVQFFMLQETFLQEASHYLSSSNKLQATVSDNHFFLTLNTQELTTEIISLESASIAWLPHSSDSKSTTTTTSINGK